jgi:hypothetical protein
MGSGCGAPRLCLTHVETECAAPIAYQPAGALIHPRPAHRQHVF